MDLKKYFYRLFENIKSKKKTFFKMFFFTIIISSSILLLSTIILYFSYEKASINEIKKKSIDQLHQSMNVFSFLNSLLISSAIQLKSEPDINNLIYQKNIDLFKISRALDRLDNTMTSYTLLHSIYIYNFQRNEYFSTINGIEEQNPSDKQLTYIINNIKKYRIYSYIPRKIIIDYNDRVFNGTQSNKEENVLSIIVGEMPYLDNTIKGALIINISEEKLRDSFLSVNNASDGDFIIIEKNGIALSHSDTKYFSTDISGLDYIKRILNDKKDSNVFISEMKGIKYLVTYYTHPQMGWRFINITPYNKIFNEISSFRNRSIFIFILLIILSFIITLLLTQQIYQPIQNLFQKAANVKDRYNLETNEKMSEIQYLDEIFKHVVTKMDYIDIYQKKNINEILKDILKGNIQPSEITEDYCKDIKVFFENDNFILSILRIDRSMFLQNHFSRDTIKAWYNSISDIINKVVTLQYHMIPENNQFVLIFSEVTNKNKILEIMQRIQKEIIEELKITVSIAISDIFMKEIEIPVVYQDTMKLIMYKFRHGTNSCVMFDEIKNDITREYKYPEEKVLSLFNELNLGKQDKVNLILDEIFNEVRDYKYEDFRLLIQMLSYNTLKMINKIESNLHYELNECRKMLENLTEIDTIIDAENNFMNTYELFIKITSSIKVNKKIELIITIKNYINDNLYDFSLCPDKVSTITGFSTHHIRNIFKENTNTSITDYINNLRIDHCKKLLSDTELTVKDIAKKCGFSNYNYFFTNFKKHTGLTPDYYRQKNKI